MSTNESIRVEADVLPAAELERLLGGQRADFPDVSVSVAAPDDRFLETAIAVAAIGATQALLLPFVTKLAERLFQAKPDAALKVGSEESELEVVISASTPADQRQDLIGKAFASGASRIRITSM